MAHAIDEVDSPDWSSLPAPILAEIVMSVMPSGPVLHWPGCLALDPPLPLWAAGTAYRRTLSAEAAVLVTLRLVCRAWREAVQQFLSGSACQWDVRVETADMLQELAGRRVMMLDLTPLHPASPYSLYAIEHLLGDLHFIQGARDSLLCALGVPESCIALLAAFPCFQSAGLRDDKTLHVSAAPMQLGRLRCLTALRELTVDLGIIDLALVPPGVTALTLLDSDRLQLPDAEGHTIVDRLVSYLERIGLRRLVLVSPSGNVVMEEQGKLFLELELGDVHRMAQQGTLQSRGHWQCSLACVGLAASARLTLEAVEPP